MSLYTTSLNSGSNGNCYYVGNSTDAVLVDVGISCREVEKRMLRLDLNIKKVKAIFISHEHADHIRGVVVLARKYQLPVYITAATLRNSPISLEKELVKPFTANKAVNIGSLLVTPFVKLHDAIEPHSFIVEGNGIKIGVLTDIGAPCVEVVHYFKQCHAAFLETNYDEKMLEEGRYPYSLKRRITGGFGHLSNAQALELFIEHRPPFMTHLFLSHLSKDNNSPELVANLFNKHSGKTTVVVASRYNETEVFEVSRDESVKQVISFVSHKRITAQLTLF
jgi:phosphoribosyl 1,2-cyclic phosphodiesterase